MQLKKCQFCKNANPQCKSVVVESISLLKELESFINYETIKKNYFIKNNNNPIPMLEISCQCTGFILNKDKEKEYYEWEIKKEK